MSERATGRQGRGEDTHAVVRDTERRSEGEETHAAMRLLREEVANLVKAVPGPVAGISLRLGECALEVTWAFPQAPPPVLRPASQPAAPVQQPAAVTTEQAAGSPEREDPASYAVTSPLVGTFYVAAEPGAPPFVRPGDRVDAGQTVGLVEAMKLMNPVAAGQAGEVVEVVVGNGEPVEYGQVLVRLRTDEP
ncbi:acetyl-CoA carboxylase biotin carboxyl carrier protein [Streptosporangium sp. NPDC049078]|uniref:acetyl-CoA carboxylase biotin carboxyl carrier protein n=1 Tax=Streptosporangium sp. NPDC049078 TaxID=3155767 RepID=UPI00342C23FB